ncbi:saccharopine dehydrogenase family protein [Jeotgalibaca sp. A122]|uniref:saccharopine dehydrogenase family protein n=1 Tax=Jeotgalibaca sp. A122 TaxID=3457322 RepID=UPI003FD04580
MKVLVLGGAGAQGYYAIEKMAADDIYDEIIISDYDGEKAKQTVTGFNNPKMTAMQLDVYDTDKLMEAMNGVDIVANCTGPFYLLLPPIMKAFMASDCKKYVDFCDDIQAFEEVMTKEAKQEAIDKEKQIIIGLGGSPGVIPVEIMHAVSMMDDAHSVQLHMIMDELGESGPAVWDHMIENFNGKVGVWKDGKYQEENGLAVVEQYDYDPRVFGDVGKIDVFSLGHPEVYTLPQVLPNLDEIKIKVSMYPVNTMDMVKDFNRIGLLETEKIEVDGVEVAPRSVLLKLMEKLYNNPKVKGFLTDEHRDVEDRPSGSAITVLGKKDNKGVKYVSSFNTLMGPITGYPVAVGVRLLAEGKVANGMMIPEEAITNPGEFVEEVYASIPELGYFLERETAIEYNLA